MAGIRSYTASSGGSSSITTGTTPSNGTANVLLKTDGSGKVNNSTITDDGTTVSIQPSTNIYIYAGGGIVGGFTPNGLFLGFSADQYVKRTASNVVNIANASGTVAEGWLQTAGWKRSAGGTNATNTMSSGVLSDLTINVQNGRKYAGCFTFVANNSTVGEGLQFDFNGGASTWTSVQFYFVATPPGVTLGTVNSAALGTALTATTVTTTNRPYVIYFEGVASNTNTLIPRFAENSAHTSGTATVAAGSTSNLIDMP